jgi:endogenous inhibitor of DNA gyrase (YacG/DUF329 family)
MKSVKCPTCGQTVAFAPENKYRPFCGERCATLDLGAWADEKYAVPAFEQESQRVNENAENESVNSQDLPPKLRRN